MNVIDDSRSQGVLVNALVFLYGSLGFGMSVVSALWSLIYRSKPQELPPLPSHIRIPKSKGRRPSRAVRSFSDQSPTTKKPSHSFSEESMQLLPDSSSFNTEKLPQKKEKSGRSSTMHSHRRSRSMIPIITIDYFESSESQRPNSADFLKFHTGDIPRPVATTDPLPQPIVYSTTDFPPQPFSSSSSTSGNDRPGLRLFNPKQWGKDKPKSTLLRSQSSPHLCHAPLLPLRVCHKVTGSDATLDSPPKNETKIKSRKTLRKMSSAPAREKTTSANSTTSPRSVEKKRSQTLRTQPYEAPYFAVPPVPRIPKKFQSQNSTPRTSSDKIESNTYDLPVTS